MEFSERALFVCFLVHKLSTERKIYNPLAGELDPYHSFDVLQ